METTFQVKSTLKNAAMPEERQLQLGNIFYLF